MNYIDEIFARGNLQKISSFLLYGTENEIDPRPYKERLETVHHTMIHRLHEKYPNEEEFENMMSFVYHYSSEAEAVYLEIGLQIGMALAIQFYQNTKDSKWGNRIV